MKIKIISIAIAAVLVATLSNGQTNGDLLHYYNGGSSSSPYLTWQGSTLQLLGNGNYSAYLNLNSESGDNSHIYSENWGENKNRLVFQTSDDGDDDYALFRNSHWSEGNKDVFEIHRTWTMANSNFYVMNGNVGVGTLSPSNLQGWNRVLDVSGLNHSKIIATTSTSDVRVGIYSHGTNWNGIVGRVGTESGHDLRLMAGYGNDQVAIKTNGNVGIGIAEPTSKLHVAGDGAVIRLQNTAYEDSENAFYGWIGGYDKNGDEVWWLGEGSGGSKELGLFANNSSYHLKLFNAGNGIVVKGGGFVGVGTVETGSHRLAVEGSIGAREIKVEAGSWSDFVFEEDYALRPLTEVEAYVVENKHLPEIPSTEEVLENGINLGEMNAKLLQKIEELTLYLIEQNKQNQAQQTEIELMKERIFELESK